MDRRTARRGTVYLVGAGPGDPDLLTLRGLELLETADAVLHDELVSPLLLRRTRADARVEYVGKRGDEPAAKQVRQSEIDARLVELAREGRSVVRLKGGDPFLFGRGSEEAEALVLAGVPFEIVPGVTSPIAAAAYAGVSLTHRDFASSVVFVSGTNRHGQAFDFRELAGHRGTVCVLMGLRRLRAIAEALVTDAGRAADTPVAVISRGTRPDQRVVSGTLADIATKVSDSGLETPSVVVVGEVVTLRDRLRWFDAMPLFGKRVLVLRAEHQANEATALLTRRGASAIEYPLLSCAPPEDLDRVRRAAREVSTYDVVAFTSVNGVERFFAVVAELGFDARAFGNARIACVGDGTARALARHGLVADLVPSSFRGESLAECLLADLEARRQDVRGGRVLLPRALVAREILPETLRARGVEVDVVPVYRTLRAGSAKRGELLARLGEGAIDALLLTSSSTVEALCDLLGESSRELLRGIVVASIGGVTTATASKRGLEVDVTSDVSTVAGLIEALERHYGAGSR